MPPEPSVHLLSANTRLGGLSSGASAILNDILRSRELIWILFLRDLKAQFRQTLLGYVWLFLPPILTTAVWLYLNAQRVITVAPSEIPYPLFVIVGTVVWQSFVRTVQSPIASVASGKPVFSKLNVSPAAFIFAGVLRALFDFTLYAITVLPILIAYGATPGWAIFLIPFLIISLFSLGTAIGIAFAPIGALYTDIQQGIPLFLGFAMYLTPVVFPLPEQGTAAILMRLNPMTPIVMSFRNILTTGSTDFFWPAIATLAFSLPAIFLLLLSIRAIMPHLVARMGM